MNILVTGGAGYIGSHTCVELLAAEHNVVVIDNLSNSKKCALDRVSALAERNLSFVEGDIRNRETLNRLFAMNNFDAVIHFAGLKAVGESTEIPLEYYDNNVGGTLTLIKCMQKYGVKTLVFSSSCTVYGDPQTVPVVEDSPRSATNPYGWSKLMIERILEDFHSANSDWSVTLLRYFNPVGAHVSGQIGEDPRGIPNNLVPYIAQVAAGKLESLRIFGNDYPTPDGTGIRDYIHVVDLAEGHLAALQTHSEQPGLHTFNLGTGRGISVLEMHAAFEKACGKSIPFQFADRRPGDIAATYADCSKATKALNWVAKRTLLEMTADTWRWQQQNPDGYTD
ncbi:MAG TPA: UDP-glucose 4-epimerase GalE [Myxococcales bacterium]|nr:UDP-glucose 4-epimerase GalE [Myxococcales bacterium]HIN85553.1 UDP-glucose 4-epimerase GalE [Myxococcales bacterium]